MTTTHKKPRPDVLRALRHDDKLEDFTWGAQRWNVSWIRHDIQAGILRPKVDGVQRNFIEQYAMQVLAQKKGQDPRTSLRTASLLMHVDSLAAVNMPADVFAQPLLMLDAGKEKGILTLDKTRPAAFVIADGNHRICKAFYEDLQALPVHQLSQAQAKRYLF